MPPTSNVRKGTAANPTAPATEAPQKRTTASGRSIRTNTTRPSNYYARPYGSFNGNANLPAATDMQGGDDQPGFFPALQYFTDAVSALPREVVRHFTLMKEVEAKIHGPNEKVGDCVDALLALPIPPRKDVAGGLQQQRGLLSLTANNSMRGSANASLVNGVPGGGAQLQPVSSAQNSVAGGSMASEEPQATDPHSSEEEITRRKQYLDLRIMTHNLLPNLDEKNVVLAEANRVLQQQLARIDSVLPHLDNEISEEARLGSMTHWAYTDNRKKDAVPAPGATQSRRDVAATNSLAAAASAIHETEIAAARRTAGRDLEREKPTGKGKRTQEQVDSDFDERPKKTGAKGTGKGKGVQPQPPAMGLGINTNGEPMKRRKVDKGLGAPAMERTASSASKTGGKGATARETPRSTPATMEPAGKAKTAKAKQPPQQTKKRVPKSAQNSPALASSPLHSSFNPNNVVEPPTSNRPSSGRLRQNSSATNLRHERTIGEDTVRPPSAAGAKASGGEKPGPKRKTGPPREESRDAQGRTLEERQAKKTTEREELKREEIEAGADREGRPVPSRSNSGKGKANGSKTGTPRNEGAEGQAMARTRSTRSIRNRDSSSAEPNMGRPALGGHRRNVSNSHLVKQLAPFNKSPDLDRHKKDDMDEDMDSDEQEQQGDERNENREEEEGRGRRARRSRPLSRRNTLQTAATGSPSASRNGRGRGGEQGRDEMRRHDEDEEMRDRDKGDEYYDMQDRHRREHHSRHGGRGGGEEDDDQPPELEPDAGSSPGQDSPQPPSHTGAHSPPSYMEEPEHHHHHRHPSGPPPPPPENLSYASGDNADDHDNDDDDMAAPEALDEPDDGSEHDPDDPDEPKYCYCNRGSYGEMVACDNDNCPREWFHLGCTELRDAPGEDEKWYCAECRPLFGFGGNGRRGRGGNGRGRGGR
ncbi:hypothetical protein KC363_g4692 [Hortaea werneckii]|uniref:Chromatin modification-related protein n=1 Tax=Hortaea werneckii TaxID=91943 RepID=A0A3M7FL74_HORWE|nr:hypothetical protein KC363_g4692 [Hortaea werneckii]RMY89386.1 hypothetical protein D0861_04282 [Hortaea werneckii]